MNDPEATINGGQSPGSDPKTNKRNSGLFAFFKWFKSASTSRESIDSTNSSSSSASCESLASLGTVASFSYVPPNDYKLPDEKSINPGPETDTYRARLKQRDKRRESDKNLTLRKKYNLFFQREPAPAKENTKSLPLLTKSTMNESDEKLHRRTNSESSKIRRAGAYLHVKGKRKAPQPPAKAQSTPSTLSLKRKKRVAPPPPSHINNKVIYNDSLKLDDGILKPVKETRADDENSYKTRSDIVPVSSPKPWYKRTTVNKEERRVSGLFQTNISELDREATEIVKEIKKNHNEQQEMMPEFMRPKIDANDTDTLTMSSSPNKRRSARDLIAKFNAITNVTKVTVFGVKEGPKRDYFGNKRQEFMLETHKKRIEQIDKKVHGGEAGKFNGLMKSESASVVKLSEKSATPKAERKSWKCPKCSLQNEYWRIICHVCSTIKPYFDDFASSSKDVKPASPNINLNKKIIAPLEGGLLERSKTQIGFSALATYNEKRKLDKSISLDEGRAEKDNKTEEKEKLKKMLIEMKNSLPKRKSHMLNQNQRTSVIEETAESGDKPVEKDDGPPKVEKCEVLIATTQTIYENIKVKKDVGKPIKVSSSAQTSNVAKEAVPSNALKNLLKQPPKTNTYELMRPKDFENIYTDKNSPAKIYANLARNDDLSLFFNMPKRLNELRTNLKENNVPNTDTIEVNRLLRRLETAIAKGELTEAALFAKELAQLKVNCSVIRQKAQNDANNLKEADKNSFQIEMFVEDKISHRGPFPLQVQETQTVLDLKKQVEREFEIPANVQRWILGKELVTNENATLKDHNITTEGCPVFLYLVAPDAKPIEVTPKKEAIVAVVPVLMEEPKKDVPKIVNVIPKTKELKPEPIVMKPVENLENKVVYADKLVINVEKQLINREQPTTSAPPLVLVEEKKRPEEVNDDYDTKTLTPQKLEWECHLCTLLNPISSNVCAVCASIRANKAYPMKKGVKKKPIPQPQPATSKDHYMQLINLDNADLVLNTEKFECVVCFTEIEAGGGCTLRECLHQFCKECLAHTIEYSDEAEVKCPYRDDNYACNITLQDREIKALVTPKVYEKHLAKSIKQAENKMSKSFHCKTVDCRGWCIFEDNVNDFRCPICRQINCLTCQAIHANMNCKQYQEKMKNDSEIDDDAKRTKEMLDEMVSKGEALTCPTCKVILMKKWGCDWLRCSMCKTEICWVTRGPRWGPAGKGDTSGGCQCGVNGVKCHPQCNYCH